MSPEPRTLAIERRPHVRRRVRLLLVLLAAFFQGTLDVVLSAIVSILLFPLLIIDRQSHYLNIPELLQTVGHSLQTISIVGRANSTLTLTTIKSKH